jgi:hypothetical protein
VGSPVRISVSGDDRDRAGTSNNTLPVVTQMTGGVLSTAKCRSYFKTTELIIAILNRKNKMMSVIEVKGGTEASLSFVATEQTIGNGQGFVLCQNKKF